MLSRTVLLQAAVTLFAFCRAIHGLKRKAVGTWAGAVAVAVTQGPG
jgi:adenosylcobinamide amidohydrolase